MNLGSDLTIDGKVRAKQATQAGECVTLGDDMKIPAEFVPSGSGGDEWLPATSTNLADYENKSAVRIKGKYFPIYDNYWTVFDFTVEDFAAKSGLVANRGYGEGRGHVVIGGCMTPFYEDLVGVELRVEFDTIDTSLAVFGRCGNSEKRMTFVLPDNFDYSLEIAGSSNTAEFTLYYKDRGGRSPPSSGLDSLALDGLDV